MKRLLSLLGAVALVSTLSVTTFAKAAKKDAKAKAAHSMKHDKKPCASNPCAPCEGENDKSMHKADAMPDMNHTDVAPEAEAAPASEEE